jgi:hypothetical protein
MKDDCVPCQQFCTEKRRFVSDTELRLQYAMLWNLRTSYILILLLVAIYMSTFTLKTYAAGRCLSLLRMGMGSKFSKIPRGRKWVSTATLIAVRWQQNSLWYTVHGSLALCASAEVPAEGRNPFPFSGILFRLLFHLINIHKQLFIL